MISFLLIFYIISPAFDSAVEDELITRNPLKYKALRALFSPLMWQNMWQNPIPPREVTKMTPRGVKDSFLPIDITKDQSFLTGQLELMTGFEPVTSSLPRMRSTY